MMLLLLVLIPFIAAPLVFFFGERYAKYAALLFSLIELMVLVLIWYDFEPKSGLQFLYDISWIEELGIRFSIGTDGINFPLLVLTSGLVPLIIGASLSTRYDRSRLFYFLLLLMQGALTGVFLALDGFLFYIFWELALIPIWLIALLWGGENRVKITLKFFVYTLFGSLLMLFAFIWLYLQTPAPHSFSLEALYHLKIAPEDQKWVFIAFFVAFAVKIPIFPFHTWQPNTYSQTTPVGTMLLSGIMLKMGLYGIIRWMLPVTPIAMTELGRPALILAVTGVVYASVIAYRQRSLRRMLAYSSIAHVGLIAAGIFAATPESMQGAFIQMISHGINVTGLFFIADIILKRTGTDYFERLGGIRSQAPRFTAFFLIVLLGSIALPLTNGFVGEFLLITGVFQYSSTWGVIVALTVILGAVYMLRAWHKTTTGDPVPSTTDFKDLSFVETVVLSLIVMLVLGIGVWPSGLLKLSESAVSDWLYLIKAKSVNL